jgi:hypothetical protein
MTNSLGEDNKEITILFSYNNIQIRDYVGFDNEVSES